ncbi:MAG: DNA primase, partial [Eubacteriales bacterium]|nr:DNA primase [Eubacteriales bacterium]
SMAATYAEFSPSGTGVHVFYKGALPGRGSKNTKTGVEMYDRARYFTMTGNKLGGADDSIAEDENTLKRIHERYIAAPKKPKKASAKTPSLGDEELLRLAFAAANGGAFKKLWEGRWQGDYPSQSEADMALCCNLAFWTGRDTEQMDRLFRQSGLMRPKWEECHYAGGATYGEEAVSHACEVTDEVYTRGEIYESKGRYYRAKGESAHRLTNFIIRPHDMVNADGETHLTADFVTDDGEVFPMALMTADFACQQKLRTVLNKQTLALSYTGTDGDLEPFKTFVHKLNWRRKTGVTVMGIQIRGGKTLFVSAEGAVDAGGTAYDDIIQPEKYRGVDSAILTREPIDAGGLRYLGQRLMSYNEPAKAISVLAWICGCFIKEHLRKRKVKFPHLMLVGEAGSGKSTTLERVIMPVFSATRIVAAGQTTSFTLMRDAASSNLIPMALDEFKPSKLDHVRLGVLLNHFRNTYDVHEGTRGRADLSAVIYDLFAPLAVAGEESADEAAVRERTVELLFSKKDLAGPARQAAFEGLCENSEALGSLGRSLLSITLAADPGSCHEWYAQILPLINTALPSRIRSNLACMGAGLRLLDRLCASLGLSWSDVFPYDMAECMGYIEYAARAFLLEGGTSNKTVVDQTLEIMSRMELDPGSEYALLNEGTHLALRLNAIYDKYTRYRKDYAIKGEILTYQQFRLQLEHTDYFIEKNAVRRINSENRRVFILNYTLLKTRCDVSGFEISESQPL